MPSPTTPPAPKPSPVCCEAAREHLAKAEHLVGQLRDSAAEPPQTPVPAMPDAQEPMRRGASILDNWPIFGQILCKKDSFVALLFAFTLGGPAIFQLLVGAVLADGKGAGIRCMTRRWNAPGFPRAFNTPTMQAATTHH